MKFRICKRCSKIYIPTSGRQEYCKECIPIVKKECDEKRYLKNKEKMNEHDKQWRKNNPEKYRESYKHWQEVHPDEWKILMARHRDKRERNLGYIPLNKFFEGSEGHHLDRDYVIYIPTEVHHSIYHSVLKDINMDEINAVAFNYL